MAKKFLVVIVAIGLVFSLAACKDKGAQPTPQGGAGGTLPEGHPQPGQGAAPGGIVMPQGEIQVVVPDNVKGKWGSIKLIVEDKAANKMADMVVKVGGELKIPNSTLVVKVGEFLPDFKMDGSLITSSSNEMNNPAVKITVTEGGKEIFKGWLYSKFPAIHPFQHEKFGLTLKEAVKG